MCRPPDEDPGWVDDGNRSRLGRVNKVGWLQPEN